MRILYHHRTQAEDGQAVHVRSLIAAFESEGHTVREVGLVKHAQKDTAPGAEAEESGDGDSGRNKWGWVTRLPRFARELAEYGYNAVARRNLIAEARDFRPDFLYERYAFANAAGVASARALKKPIVLEVNSPMVLELQRTRGLSFPRMARSMERFVFRSADRVCTVTGVLRDMLVEMGVERERIFVTPNGVHLEQYDYVDREAVRASAREDLGLPPGGDDIVLGFVGYYRTWHRLDLAVEALATGALSHARLVLIGEGPAREELEAKAQAAGVSERVHFAGPRPHGRIPELLPAFDIALVPAINPYASPLKLHEYMAASLATIAPDQENLREVLRDGENALLVEPGDGDQLCSAILRLAQEEALRESLAARARATIEEDEMTWTGNARRVLNVAEELLR